MLKIWIWAYEIKWHILWQIQNNGDWYSCKISLGRERHNYDMDTWLKQWLYFSDCPAMKISFYVIVAQSYRLTSVILVDIIADNGLSPVWREAIA